MNPNELSPLIPMVQPQVDGVEPLVEQLAGILRSGRLTNGGPFLAEFEETLARFLGVQEVVAVTNGAVAIDMAIAAARVPQGKAILPSFTFIATLNAAVHSGFEPVFCDIDPETWTLDPNHLQELIAKHEPTLIMPVNVFGIPPDLRSIAAMAQGAGAAVVYDCAHGMGTRIDGADRDGPVTATTFSLHATKVLVAGEGGVVVSADPKVSATLRQLRNHGLTQPLTASTYGFNGKLDELRAAVALASLRRFAGVLEARRKYFERLRAALSRHPGVYRVQRVPEGVHPNGQNLGVWLPDIPIEKAIAAFAQQGVEARRYFYPPLHTLSQLSGAQHELPHTERLCASQVCLPLHAQMNEPILEQIETAIAAVAREFE